MTFNANMVSTVYTRMLIYQITILVLLSVKEIVVSEPHCSRYHYEERTLEKMIRLEILVEKLKSEMEETQKQTKDTLRDLQDFRINLSDQFSDLKEQSRSDIEKKSEYVNNLKESLSLPSVVFQARKLSTLNPATGDTLVFTTTMQDSAYSYDNTTGIFRAPFAGTYIFNVQLCLQSGSKYIHYAIVVEAEAVTNTLLHDAEERFCNSASAIVILRKDNVVHIKNIGSSISALRETSNSEWNTFTGVMIKK